MVRNTMMGYNRKVKEGLMFIIIIQQYNLSMKSEFKPRPQSKRLERTVKPPSRYVNTEQAKSTFQQGKAEQAKENYQKAIELYIRATVYDPNFYQAYCNIGSCYRALQQYIQSKRYYQKSIAIKKDDPISHYNLGNVLRILGDYESSINHYLFVIRLKEQNSQDIGSLYLNSLINLGICYKNKNLFDKACQCYQKARSIDGKDQTCLFNYAMSIVGSIRGLDEEIFQQVVKQKANKAIEMLRKCIETKKANEMLQFQLIRMSLIKDKSNQNINKVMDQLKQMLNASNCTLADQINSELGYCLKLLKNYEDSAKHYKKSISQFNKRKQSQKLENTYDQINSQIHQQVQASKFTQEEGIKMIQQGLYQEVRQRMKQLQENSLQKHVLEIALELGKVDQQENHLKQAAYLYQKYFIVKGKEIQMDQISIAGHKTIGHLLAMQGKYQESIKHFQYITAKISQQHEKSKIHSFIGNDYEAMGDVGKALEQYKIALESQPESYEVNYNLGCCFYEQGQFQEAKSCFQKALALVEKDLSLSIETRQLYTADCLVVLASCLAELEHNKSKYYDIFYKTWMILQQVLSSSSQSDSLQQRKIMKFYLEWAELLEQKMSELRNKKSQEYTRSKQLLLQVYICLLNIENCPDRDAILNNSATIYYEDKLYANALVNFNQIESQQIISYNNLAVTYLNLNEHFMATQQICKLVDGESWDQIQQFNKETICWIYGLPETQNQILVKQFNNDSNQAMVFRLEYAKIVIEVISNRISQLSQAYELSQVKQILQTSAQSDFLLQFLQETQRSKLRALILVLKEQKSKPTEHVDPNLLAIALKESSHPQEELNQIIKKCVQSSEFSQGVVEVLINLFIFCNQNHVPKIRGVLQKWTKFRSQSMVLNLDRRVTITPQMTGYQFDGSEIKNLHDLLSLVINWQCQLQCKLVTLTKLVERSYYKSNFRRPIQYQYMFPRHPNWAQDNNTFYKIANIVRNLLPQQTFSLKGNSLKQMKAQIFKQLQNQLYKHLKNKETFKLSLNQRLTPVVMYCFFQSKNDCLVFLKELQKQSSWKGAIDIGRETQEVSVLVSSIIRLVCQWEEPNSNLNIIRSFLENQLPLEAQSVISLEADLQILKESSKECCQLIEKIPIFKI